MSVGWLVGHTLLFRRLQAVFCITAPAQMLGLAIFITAPAHPHATSAAVYPALFSLKLFSVRYIYLALDTFL